MTRKTRTEGGACSGSGSPHWTWIASQLSNLTHDTMRKVESWVGSHGGCFAPAGRARLREEAASAVHLAVAEALDNPSLSDAHPLQVRYSIVKRAAGLVMSTLRPEWHEEPTQGETLASLVGEPDEPPSRWLTSVPLGRPAKPLIVALVQYETGEDIPAITAAVAAEGCELSPERVAVELLAVLRFAHKMQPQRFRWVLRDARARLEPWIRGYLIPYRLKDRDLVVVVDAAFGVSSTVTAAALGCASGRVRNIRRHAKQSCPGVREVLERTTAFGWPLTTPS